MSSKRFKKLPKNTSALKADYMAEMTPQINRQIVATKRHAAVWLPVRALLHLANAPPRQKRRRRRMAARPVCAALGGAM